MELSLGCACNHKNADVLLQNENQSILTMNIIISIASDDYKALNFVEKTRKWG